MVLTLHYKIEWTRGRILRLPININPPPEPSMPLSCSALLKINQPHRDDWDSPRLNWCWYHALVTEVGQGQWWCILSELQNGSRFMDWVVQNAEPPSITTCLARSTSEMTRSLQYPTWQIRDEHCQLRQCSNGAASYVLEKRIRNTIEVFQIWAWASH